MFTWIITILVQIYFGNYIARKCLLVAHVDLIGRICQKQSQKLNLKKNGECVFRRDGPLLCFKWREKKDVTMLSTIHEAVETGKTDREGNKIEKPEAVYYYCSRMGGVDLSDQLLNYFSFLRKSTKWSRKLLIHLFNRVILNAHILNKHYVSAKLTQDEYRGYIVKYLVSEGLKCYKIPLPSIISRKLGKHNTDEHNRTRLNEHHFISNIPGGRVEKGRNHREIVLFAVEYQVLT